MALSLSDNFSFSRDIFLVRSLLGVDMQESSPEEIIEDEVYAADEFRRMMAELESSADDEETEWE